MASIDRLTLTIAMAALVVGCGDGDLGQAPPSLSGDESTTTSATSASTTTIAAPPTSLAELEEEDVLMALRYEPEASGFNYWTSQAVFAGLESETYRSLEDMTKSASVVLVGQLQGAPTTRELDIPKEEDPGLTIYQIRVKVLDVLAGSLRPDDGDEIVIESVFPYPQDPPKQATVLFLRHALDGDSVQPVPPEVRDKYRLVSSQGVYVDTSDGVSNPASVAASGDLAPTAVDPVLQETLGLAVDEFVDLVRQYGQ